MIFYNIVLMGSIVPAAEPFVEGRPSLFAAAFTVRLHGFECGGLRRFFFFRQWRHMGDIFCKMQLNSIQIAMALAHDVYIL